MDIQIPHRLLTTKAPEKADTPWLKGRATRWMVAADWPIYINGKPEMVPAGYIFNGSSIPWALWWIFPPTYDPAWEASCIHDWLYSHRYSSVTKEYADSVFRAVMIRKGASPLVAGLFHFSVKKFGKGGW